MTRSTNILPWTFLTNFTVLIFALVAIVKAAPMRESPPGTHDQSLDDLLDFHDNVIIAIAQPMPRRELVPRIVQVGSRLEMRMVEVDGSTAVNSLDANSRDRNPRPSKRARGRQRQPATTSVLPVAATTGHAHVDGHGINHGLQAHQMVGGQEGAWPVLAHNGKNIQRVYGQSHMPPHIAPSAASAPRSYVPHTSGTGRSHMPPLAGNIGNVPSIHGHTYMPPFAANAGSVRSFKFHGQSHMPPFSNTHPATAGVPFSQPLAPQPPKETFDKSLSESGFSLFLPEGIDPYHSKLMDSSTDGDHQAGSGYSIMRQFIQQSATTQSNPDHLSQLIRMILGPHALVLTAVDANRLVIKFANGPFDWRQAIAALQVRFGAKLLRTTVELAHGHTLRAERVLAMFEKLDTELAKPMVDEVFMRDLCASPLIDEQDLLSGDTVYLRAVKARRENIAQRLLRCGSDASIADWSVTTAQQINGRAASDKEQTDMAPAEPQMSFPESGLEAALLDSRENDAVHVDLDDNALDLEAVFGKSDITNDREVTPMIESPLSLDGTAYDFEWLRGSP